MKYGKLAVISIVVFYLMFWAFSLLFPGTTVISRVATLPASKQALAQQFAGGTAFFSQWLIDAQATANFKVGTTSFYPNNLVNTERQAGADTIFFSISAKGIKPITGGVALYEFSPDSTLTQLFYVFNTPWYKPWDKMATMMNDKRYGTGMDSALLRLERLLTMSN